VTTRFATPTTLSEALEVLASDVAARPVAGGTDLVVAARQGRRPLPESIVAIHRIAELATTNVTPDELVMGALTSHAWLARCSDVRTAWTALADASAIVGSPATRGTGTVGGNLMNASPAAETTAPLVVFGARATLARRDGSRRTVDVADLATGPGRTVAEPGELLVDVGVPRPPSGSGSAYIRLEYRRAMEIAVVGAAVLVTLDASGSTGAITSARIALTAVAPTVVEASAAAAGLTGSTGDAEACRAAGRIAATGASPIDDVRASAEYRRAMIEVVVARTVAAAVARARGDEVPIPASRWAPGRAV
jgi:CO/xanthine dehydrogenase FAD-binding subunit